MPPEMIWCTCPDFATGQALAEQLVKKQLAACVNIIPTLTSIYRWENQVEQTSECLLVIKTTSSHQTAIMKFIASQHPRPIPEIAVVPLTAGWPPYLQWLTQNCP